MAISIVQYNIFVDDWRFDAEYYHKSKLASEKKLIIYNDIIGDNFSIEKQIEAPKNNNVVFVLHLDNIVGNRINNIIQMKSWQVGSSKKIIKKGDVIISRLRSYLKQIAINHDYEKLYGSTEFLVLREKSHTKINKEYLFAFLLTDEVQNILRWSQEGSNHPRFSSKMLNKMRIPVPSVVLQKIIKEKIDKANDLFLMAKEKYGEAEMIIDRELEIDKLITRNKKVNYINRADFVSVYRLDAQYFSSKELKNLFSEAFDPKPLEILCKKIENGLTPAKDSYWYKGYPILKMGCLTNNGIDWTKIEYANEDHFKKARKYLVKEDDIFLTSSAHAIEHIGMKVDIIIDIPEQFNNKLVYVGEIMRLRANRQLINPFYLLMFLRTEAGYKLLQNCIRGQTAHIYPKDVQHITIPMISDQKQERIEELIKEVHYFLKESSRHIYDASKEITKLIN